MTTNPGDAYMPVDYTTAKSLIRHWSYKVSDALGGPDLANVINAELDAMHTGSRKVLRVVLVLLEMRGEDLGCQLALDHIRIIQRHRKAAALAARHRKTVTGPGDPLAQDVFFTETPSVVLRDAFAAERSVQRHHRALLKVE